MRGALAVSWSRGSDNLGQPILQDDDVILLYCDDQLGGTPGEIHEKIFLDAATVAQAKATSRKHYGGQDTNSHGHDMWHFPSFPLERHDACQFHLYKMLSRNRITLLAKSNMLHIQNGNSQPTAIHLAFTNRVDEMVVQFKTGKINGTPMIKYGTEKDALTLHANGSSSTYTAKDMCQDPAKKEEPGKFQPPGLLHVVKMTHLEPNTTYYYQVGVNHERVNVTTWSEIHSFLSPPEIRADAEPHSFLVYADQGSPSDGWGQGGAWIAAMATREANLPTPIRSVHHFGDISYARGAAHIWDEWLNMVSPFAVKVPLMVSIGNHEYDHTDGGGAGKDPSGVPTKDGYKPRWGNFGTDSGGECGVPTARHFFMPHSSGSNGVFWYSYNFANVHTIAISSEHDMSLGSKQYRWLEEDLKSVDRSLLPWIVLELHRPFYESEVDPIDSVVGMEMLHRIEHLLKTYQVDLVLAGHLHSYERSCAGLYKGKCNVGGPTHIIVGTAGAKLMYDPKVPSIHWTKKIVRGHFGYGRVTVANATSMHFEFVRAGANDDPAAGTVLDDVWIVKGQGEGMVRSG
ncbi:Probable inactive purple acid phosphatase [Seminavis robusta]|uniref:Purple acid phosphatase n=1 Tax=Seminavis robusta TaxID=568900 RepID=A0A9N8DTV5_9STRA|nr:Probable inactive purple acid phosphatase [Seminavis robusta]|eukprot:Sro353_g124370.1 Probable inactive purple acid phosphatase (571) ;mRNA; f:6-1718